MLNATEEFKKQVFSVLSSSFFSMYLYLFIYFDRFFQGGGWGPLMTFVIEIEKGRHTLPKTPENL